MVFSLVFGFICFKELSHPSAHQFFFLTQDILFSIAPTNGDPNCDVKRIKPPTGIPKFMLVASGAVAVLKPNEYVIS